MLESKYNVNEMSSESCFFPEWLSICENLRFYPILNHLFWNIMWIPQWQAPYFQRKIQSTTVYYRAKLEFMFFATLRQLPQSTSSWPNCRCLKLPFGQRERNNEQKSQRFTYSYKELLFNYRGQEREDSN